MSTDKKATEQTAIEAREVWLKTALALLVKHVLSPRTARDLAEHPPRISCGFAKGVRSQKSQTFLRADSSDGVNEIFISPELDEPLEVLAHLAHNAIHASLDSTGHTGKFASRASLTGFVRSFVEPNPTIPLKRKLRLVSEACGPYPHAALDIKQPAQKSRQLKAECRKCKAIWRMARSWLVTAKFCPVCGSDNIDKHGL